MSDFLPSISQIGARLGLSGETRLETVDRVVVDGDFLRFLLGMIASGFALDARAYRREHGLSSAADWDGFAPASAHFASEGFFAGLTAVPRNFDEDWYLTTYPDARAAVEEGLFPDGLSHYLATGRAEWRLPNAGAAQEVQAWRHILRPVGPESARVVKPAAKPTTDEAP